MANLFKQRSTATSGTVTIQDTKQDVQLIHDAASVAATLTVTFPATPVDGQVFGMTSRLGVTVLTLSSAISLVGDVSTLPASRYLKYMYDVTSNKWFRIEDLSAPDTIDAYTLMGANILVEPIGNTLSRVTTSSSIGDGSLRLIAMHVPRIMTITGVKCWMAIQGDYVADNYNGIGLYSYSGGTLTLVASSTNDGDIWKASSTSLITKAFSATYEANPGIYYVGLLYNNSSETTAPTVGYFASTLSGGTAGALFTNSARLAATLTGQDTLPASFAASTATGSTGWAYVALY